MNNAAIYVRVSTDEQAENGKSVETQLKLCNKYAVENRLTIGENTFIDEGKSATNMNRSGLQDMLLAVQDKDKQIKFLLIQDTDRLARNTLDHLNIKLILKKNDVQLISINQPLLDDSPEGNLIDTVLAATNAFSSQLTGRKTSKVLEQKAEMGWFPGGTPALGYRNADNPSPTSTLDQRIIVIDDSVAPYIKHIFERYAEGNINMDSLAKYLNESGVKSPLRRSTIHTSLITRILQSPFYIGKFYWKKKLYHGRHELFISNELFNKVKEIIAIRNKNNSRVRKHSMLLRGFLFYEPSGHQMWGEIKQKSDRQYKHYFCPKTKKGSYTPADEIENSVAELFGKIQISEAYRIEIMDKAKQLLKEFRSSREEQLAHLSNEKAKYQKAISEAEDDRYIRNIITSEALMRVVDKYKPLLKNSEEELAKLDVDHSERLKSLDRILKLTENIGQSYIDASPQLKREYLTLFFKKFYVNDKQIVKYELSPEVRELIETGSVRVSAIGLRGLDEVRTCLMSESLGYIPVFSS